MILKGPVRGLRVVMSWRRYDSFCVCLDRPHSIPFSPPLPIFVCLAAILCNKTELGAEETAMSLSHTESMEHR